MRIANVRFLRSGCLAFEERVRYRRAYFYTLTPVVLYHEKIRPCTSTFSLALASPPLPPPLSPTPSETELETSRILSPREREGGK